MRKLNAILLIVLMCATAVYGGKLKGTTTLKDLQPTGNTDKKNNKTQQYDLFFGDKGNSYTCRTTDKIKATDFVVGNDLKFEIDGDKAKLKNARGKELKCTIVRVENLSAAGK